VNLTVLENETAPDALRYRLDKFSPICRIQVRGPSDRFYQDRTEQNLPRLLYRFHKLSDMSSSKWAHFVRQCLLHRTHGDEFCELVEFVNEKYQISGREIIQTIVKCRRSFSISSDPLIPQYVRAAVTSGLSQTSDVLYVLVQNWNSKDPNQGLLAELKNPGCLSSPDALIINDLALVIASNKPSAITSDVRKSLSCTSRWLVALIGWISEDGESRYYLAILTLLEALGILFASIISTEQGMGLLGSQEDSGKHRNY
jgi:hypothetical protein